jgi:hypothetical protein
MVWSGKKIIRLPPATSAQEAELLQQHQTIVPGFDYSCSAKGVQQCKALSDFLSTHVPSGLYVWQYCKHHPPTAKPPASNTAEQAHAAAPSQPAATVAASGDAAAPGAPSLPEPLHWLPGPVPRDAVSAALLNEWPGDAQHKTYAPYSVVKGFEPDHSLRQRSRRVHRQQPLQLRGKLCRKRITGAREQRVQCMCVPPFSATSATKCALCTANNLCASSRSCMRAAEQLC